MRILKALFVIALLFSTQNVEQSFAQKKKPAKTQAKKEVKPPKRHRGTDTVGIVNGEVIMLRDFKSVLSEIVRSAASDSIVSEENWTVYVDAAWDKCVEAVVLQQEIEKRKLSLTDDEVKEHLVTNTPEFLVTQFSDPSGNFNREALQYALNDPTQDSIVQIVVGAERFRLENDRLMKSVAPDAQSDADRQKLFAAWLNKQKNNARQIDRRIAFGYY